MRIILESQPDADHPNRYSLVGLVTGLEDLQAAEAQLWRSDQWLAAISLDEAGGFSLGDVAPTSYTLVISAPGIQVRVPDLIIGP